MLPTLVDAPPAGDRWTHEIKYDGYRTQLHLDRAGHRAFTRNGFDWTPRYAALLNAAEKLSCQSAIIDGEVIVQDEHGRSDFNALRVAIEQTPNKLIFYAFDILTLDGRDLRIEPLELRRELLEEMIGEPDPGFPIHFSSSLVRDGPTFFKMIAELNLEGIVSKKLGTTYRSGRTKVWLKAKTFTEGEFVVIGHDRADNGPALALLARETESGLEYTGSAFVTLRSDDRERFWRRMETLATDRPAIPLDRAGSWVKPRVRVKVRHLSGGDKLRHATLVEVLHDQKAH